MSLMKAKGRAVVFLPLVFALMLSVSGCTQTVHLMPSALPTLGSAREDTVQVAARGGEEATVYLNDKVIVIFRDGTRVEYRVGDEELVNTPLRDVNRVEVEAGDEEGPGKMFVVAMGSCRWWGP